MPPADKAGAKGEGGRAPVSAERAQQIVEKAAKEAGDVIQSTQADPLKKPKQVKAAVKEAVAKLVESGDPAQVVQYIKNNRKDFVSGVYQSWFMKEIRAQLDGAPPAAAVAKETKEPAKAAGSKAAAASSLPGKRAGANQVPILLPPQKRRKKEKRLSEESDDSDGSAAVLLLSEEEEEASSSSSTAKEKAAAAMAATSAAVDPSQKPSKDVPTEDP